LGHLGSFWLFFVPSVGCSLRRSKCQARKGKFLFPALSCFDNKNEKRTMTTNHQTGDWRREKRTGIFALDVFIKIKTKNEVNFEMSTTLDKDKFTPDGKLPVGSLSFAPAY